MSSDTQAAPVSQLPPAWVPPPLNEPCGCASEKNLCGVLIFPKEPKPSDGIVEESSSEPDDISIQGPDGKNCGPLYLPGITPSPKPSLPTSASPEEVEKYQALSDEWTKGYDEWKDITCPCGLGYFDEDGVWKSGADVRNGIHPPNSRWETNGGVAPPRNGGGQFHGNLSDRK